MKGKGRGPVNRPPAVPTPFGFRVPVGKEDIVLHDVGEVVEDPLADTESNELHAGVGTICPRCNKEITEGQPVQRVVSGGFEHQVCPPA